MNKLSKNLVSPSEITDEKVWKRRRQIIRAGGLTAGAGLLGGVAMIARALSDSPERQEALRGDRFRPVAELEPTPLRYITSYNVSAHESTPVFRTQPAPDFLLPHHHAGERHGTKRCH